MEIPFPGLPFERSRVLLAFLDGEGAYISSRQNRFDFFHFSSQSCPQRREVPEGRKGCSF